MSAAPVDAARSSAAVDAAAPPLVVALDDPRALDAELVGAKAANLARLASIGLPVLPGFVVTTAATAGGRTPDTDLAARQCWSALAVPPDTALVVRSSSTIEDAATSSMAGRFTSVLDVRGWDAFCRAVDTVTGSATGVGAPAPMAVLVQRQLSAAVGGVLFGADPVMGRADRLVVEWVCGRPDSLVSGRAVAAHAELSPRGRARSTTLPAPGESTAPVAPLPRWARRRLAQVAHTTAVEFGAPQDVEWAIAERGILWLLQSRPVTALHLAPTGRHHTRLGTGPVAETFPQPLTPLEIDLWVPPLREGIIRALRATGAVGDAALRRSPVVTTVDGRVVIDLDLITGADHHPTWRRLVSPRAVLRHLRTAWRVGRLRVALPLLASTVVQSVDEHLGAVGRVGASTDDDLRSLLDRCRAELATVHSYEVLTGMLLPVGESVPAHVLALRALHDGRRLGLADDELVALRPEVLALSAPCVTAPVQLPASSHGLPAMAPEGATLDDLSCRDALRMRARWLHELQCRAARELGHRAAMRGALSDASSITYVSLGALTALGSGTAPVDIVRRPDRPTARALPTEFVLADDGTVLPVPEGADRHRWSRRRGRDGIAAGGGRGEGDVIDAAAALALANGVGIEERRSTHYILVTEHLEPGLAVVLPVLDGLVAETGSALSHLAILARETGVPAVVGVADARQRFPVGTHVVVDGVAGTVPATEVAAPADSAAGVTVGHV
ncbi:MAG: PEP/pyruvate-binding domain-containing protein, partial [Ilumatobacteraceae bacterium]